MSPHQTLKGLNNATFLPESEGGLMPCVSQVFPITSHAGRVAHHVNHSAQQVSSSANLMSDILPLHSCVSSLSAALQSSLESKLQQRLQSIGSMIYSMSWREKSTPAGRQYCQRLASALRTKETDCFLVPHYWNTPAASDGTRGGTGITEGMTGSSLSQVVKMAAWPSPCAQNGTINGYKDPDKVIARKEAGRQQNLQDVVILCNQPIRITATGQVLTGSDARMENSGRLKPEHSRWLMGFPPEWDVCAVMVTP
ncbi:Uncharacterised protein [Enterobacter hormaechei]|nr:Uncharacterised protein [Enterobacter hormaechei]